MAISWDSIRALVIFFGPVLLPKAISTYRSLRSSSHPALPVQPVPQGLRIALFALSLLSFSLVLTALLPSLSPENIFLQTQSRLQIPADVLFTRLASLRADNHQSSLQPSQSHQHLLHRDAALRARFANLENRLIYLHLGPDVLADCPFCSPDDPRSYFLYAIPALLGPHVANLAALAAATSPSLTRARWRPFAVIAATSLAALDLYLVGSYPHQRNARALRLQDIDFFYWNLRSYRLLALAALDALLAGLLWLSATNRAFARLPSPAERVELLARGMLAARSRLNALGIVKNTVARDEALRAKALSYWQHEGRLMGEVMEEREVIEGVNDALSNRIDIAAITRDAEQYAGNVLGPLE